MGGIARRATAIKDYRRQHPDRPLLLVETGNAMKQGDDLDDPASRWVVEALQALGSHAVNTTVADLRRLNRLVERGRVPNDLRTAYLATAIEPPSGKHFPTKPYLVQPLRAEKGNEEVRVGILAVSAGNEGSVDVGKVIDVDEALRRHVPEVDAQSDIVVLLDSNVRPRVGKTGTDLSSHRCDYQREREGRRARIREEGRGRHGGVCPPRHRVGRIGD